MRRQRPRSAPPRRCRPATARVLAALSVIAVLMAPAHSVAGPCPAIPQDLSPGDESRALELLRAATAEADIRGAGFQVKRGVPIPMLHVAAYKGCLDFVRYYLSVHGMDHVSVRNPAGMNVLHIAVWQGHTPVVKFLLDQGADPSETIDQIIVMGKDSSMRVLTKVDAARLAEAQGHADIVRLISRRKPWWKFWRV